jgi:hypothetical protein
MAPPVGSLLPGRRQIGFQVNPSSASEVTLLIGLPTRLTSADI